MVNSSVTNSEAEVDTEDAAVAGTTTATGTRKALVSLVDTTTEGAGYVF